MRFPHLFHRDANWQQRGLYAYHQCRCGARRVRRMVANMHGPVDTGWPPLVDKHGRAVNDSGWQPPAAAAGTVLTE